MIGLLKNIDSALKPLWDVSKYGEDISLFIARLFMANIFFKSGKLKFENFLNGDFDTVIYLFEDIHPVPGIPVELAAYAGTFAEVFLPILLVFGLLGRVGALGLLVMSAVIQFAVPAEYEVAHPQHYMWMLLLAWPLFHGMGRVSVDYWLAKWFRSK